MCALQCFAGFFRIYYRQSFKKHHLETVRVSDVVHLTFMLRAVVSTEDMSPLAASEEEEPSEQQPIVDKEIYLKTIKNKQDSNHFSS